MGAIRGNKKAGYEIKTMEDQEKEPSEDTLVKVILRIIGFGVALAALVYGMLVYRGTL
ncbi:hypothetical protein BH09BAC4_BH09BAC4_44130 [soil metagenome]